MVGEGSEKRGNLLVDFVLGGLAAVGGEVIAGSLAGAAEESAEVFVQVGQEHADGMVSLYSLYN